MPIPEDRLYKSDRLNRWFAVSSILMTASLFWLIAIDYGRPWHEHQASYFVAKATMAHLDYLDAQRAERKQAIERARQRLEDARTLVAETTGEKRSRLRAKLAEAELEYKKVEGPWSKISQVLDVTRDSYERALRQLGEEHNQTQAILEKVHEQERKEEALRQQKEHWGDEKKAIEQQLDEINKPIETAEKRLRSLQREVNTALKNDRQYRGAEPDKSWLGDVPIVGMVINLPLFDFAAPKNTPSRYQVNQLVLPDVRQDLNYLESYTTDRCTTCHVSIDEPEFSRDRLAVKLERSLPGINEALQRMGESPLDPPKPPTVEATGEELPLGQVTKHWDALTRDQQKAYFEALLKTVNDYLQLAGRQALELGQPLLAHPDLDLYVSVDSPHPMKQIGCTVCHEGNGQETDFVLAAHTPATHKVEEEWKEKYYIERLGIPNTTFETVAHYWDRPMRLEAHIEAGCVKCHEHITDIARYKGERKGRKINLGRHLFTQVGCINCHNVDSLKGSRRVGPDMTHLAEKVKPAFLQQWVRAPKKFRPSTWMPHFFGQENNRTESANKFDTDPVTRTETEIAAISAYLFAVSKEWEPIKKPENVTGDVERGRDLFKSVGCLACHTNVAEFGEEWIANDLVQREGLDKETALYRYKGMTQEERVRYAMAHFVSDRDTIFYPEKAQVDPTMAEAEPRFSRFAPELSGIGSKVSAEWLYSWLIEPTHYSPDTKMPNLRLTPGEAADITAYLMTLKNREFDQSTFEMNATRQAMADSLIFDLLSAQRSERHSRAIMRDIGSELTDMLVALLAPSMGDPAAYDLIRPMTLEDKKLMYLGRKMITHYGCYACHKIRGFEETTRPGTDLTTWAEKPIAQLDFAFYNEAFHEMREEQPEVYGYVYPLDAEKLNSFSPIDDRAKEQITHTHGAFAKHKMLNPRIWDRGKIKKPYDKLKMPNFFFTEEEADALTTFLMSRMSPRVNDTLTVDYEGSTKGPLAEGRALTRELNCIGCHKIEDNEPLIQQYYFRVLRGTLELDDVNAPPRLWGEGAKLQHHWFHRFLQHVEPLRPWLQVRMPSFPLTGAQATTLVEYFAALSQQDSLDLNRELAPVEEYIARAREKAGESAEKSDAETGADWYQVDSLKDEAAALRRWAIERLLMRERDLDPLRTPPERYHESHADLLERVEFMRDLYDVAYPFVEPPRPVSSDERVAMGASFLDDMGCLSCHVLGRMLPGPAKNTDDFVQMYRLDGVRGEGEEALAILNGERYAIGSVIDGHTLISAKNVYNETGDVQTTATVEGPAAGGGTERIVLQAASAPNLSLTHRRLRRTWVYNWMLNPGWIQPGTKMPQNFRNGISPFAGDERYPGTGEDHINLLVDYLYDAGALGIRAPLVKIIAMEESETFDEGMEFDEDEFD